MADSISSAAVLYAALDIVVEQRSVPPPPPGHAQVKILATGLCGSDLHYYQHARNGDFKVQAPLCLGHEAAGIVTALGPPLPVDPNAPPTPLDHTHPVNRPLKVGDRVALEVGMMCRNCMFCKTGRYNLCTTMSFRSSAKTFPHADGTLQSLLNHPVSLLHPTPSNISCTLAAMAEPLSVILHATRRTRMVVPDIHSTDCPVRPVIAIFGAGTIGLLAAALAKSPLYPLQASRVLLLDINKERLEYAANHGFVKREDTYVLPMGDRSRPAEERLQFARDNISKAMSRLQIETGVDCVYECTGAEPCIQMGILAARAGGCVMTIGMGSSSMTTPLLSAATREVDLIGVFRYANTYPEALHLLSECEELRSKVEKLMTHRFTLDRTTEAFELLARGKSADGGVVLKVIVGTNES